MTTRLAYCDRHSIAYALGTGCLDCAAMERERAAVVPLQDTLKHVPFDCETFTSPDDPRIAELYGAAFAAGLAALANQSMPPAVDDEPDDMMAFGLHFDGTGWCLQ